MKKLIAGNWKMNGLRIDAQELAADIVNGIYKDEALLERCNFLVCPPSIHIGVVRHTLQNVDSVILGAQDCSAHENGAYTGDISAQMLSDSSCAYVILGHSERRQYHEESNELVAQKAILAHESGRVTIICVGESEQEREEGREKDVVGAQLAGSMPGSCTAKNTVIAYEPVWAIGTGKTACVEDVRVMHAFIREKLKERLEDYKNMRILYGGSMKPANAKELLTVENVDGGLIGGASLSAEQFLGIAKEVH